MSFKPSQHSHSNPGVRMGAGPPTGQYYVSLQGHRGRHPDGWHWGILEGRVPETVKIKGPLVPGQRVQFKRLHKDTSVQWAIFRSRKKMARHESAATGPGIVSYDQHSYHPGARISMPTPTPNPRPKFGPGIWSGYWFMDKQGRCWKMPMGMRGWVPSELLADGTVQTHNGAVYRPEGQGDCSDVHKPRVPDSDYALANAGGASQNGWPASDVGSEIDLVFVPISGATPHGGFYATAKAADALEEMALWWSENIEPIKTIYGWNYRVISGTSTLSNHSSGTAIDINAADHPMGAEGTVPTLQRAAIMAKALSLGLRWGGIYKDEMHFEVDLSPTAEMFRKTAFTVAKGYLTVAGIWILTGGLVVGSLGILITVKQRKKRRRQARG